MYTEHAPFRLAARNRVTTFNAIALCRPVVPAIAYTLPGDILVSGRGRVLELEEFFDAHGLVLAVFSRHRRA